MGRIPRPRGRGLIEAFLLSPESRILPEFRDRAVAASLKPDRRLRDPQLAAEFRDRAVAASLKLE